MYLNSIRTRAGACPQGSRILLTGSAYRRPWDETPARQRTLQRGPAPSRQPRGIRERSCETSHIPPVAVCTLSGYFPRFAFGPSHGRAAIGWTCQAYAVVSSRAYEIMSAACDLEGTEQVQGAGQATGHRGLL
jgi:hypothetical protein